MSPKKSGTVFIVLMISLLAFGAASSANIANIGTGLFGEVKNANLSLHSQDQVTAIGDTSFQPVYVNKRVIVNVTNTTTPITPIKNSTTNNTNSG